MDKNNETNDAQVGGGVFTAFLVSILFAATLYALLDGRPDKAVNMVILLLLVWGMEKLSKHYAEKLK